jgi:zinc/manganese transport system substrate-binding protein
MLARQVLIGAHGAQAFQEDLVINTNRRQDRTDRNAHNDRPLGRIGIGVGLVAALLALGGERPAWAQLRVAATVPDLAALAREVGGPAVKVESLSLPTQDPHFVDAKPSLALVLNRSDLLLQVGLDLEIGWLPTLLVGSRNARIQPSSAGHLDCSQFVHRLDVPAGPVDRSQGDIHPGGNPHYLYDPRAAAAVVKGIAARLGQLVPAKAALFARNRDALLGRLQAARTRWEKRLQPLRGAPIITYHKTFSYLADWLGLAQIGFLEPKPGIPPNPRHVASLLALARARKVRLLLQESHYPDATSKLLAGRIPAPLVRVPSATNLPAGESYLQHLDVVLEKIATGTGVKP